MKSNNLTLPLLLCLSLCWVQMSAASECSSHQGWIKTKAYLTEITKGQSAVEADLSNIIEAFESSTPNTSTSDDLGVCSQYVGQKSCCNARIASYIDKIVLYKVKPILEKDTYFAKLLTYLNMGLQNSTYVLNPGVTRPTSGADILARAATLSTVSNVTSLTKQAKIAFGKAIAAETRGALCLACAGTDSVASFFDSNSKVILNQAAINLFRTATDTILSKYSDDMQNNIDNLVSQVLDYYLDNSEDNQTIKREHLYNAVDTFSNKIDIKLEDGSGVCQGLRSFTADSGCEGTIGGNAILDSILRGDARLLKQESAVAPRMLVSIVLPEDSVVSASSTGGITSYIVSPTDDKITDSGSVTIDATYATGTTTFGAKGTIFSLISLSFMCFLVL